MRYLVVRGQHTPSNLSSSMAYCCEGGAHTNGRSVKRCLTNDATNSFKKIHKGVHRTTHYSQECEYDANLKYLIYPPRRCVLYSAEKIPHGPLEVK